MTDSCAIPQHVAIIMDGNGRWAARQKMPRNRGHREGAESLNVVAEECARLGVKILTVYAFSTENWSRPKTEVSYLMRMLRKYLVQQRKKMMDSNTVLEAIGRIGDLPDAVQEALGEAIHRTRNNTGLRVCLALNYGGRAEIVDAARALAEKARQGALMPEQIDETTLQRHLYTDSKGEPFPPPDLIIRTAGEMRLSNFLLWQASYAEFYVTDVCWPDFRQENLRTAIAEYGRRIRRYGGLKDTTDDRQSTDRPGADHCVSRSSAP